MSMKSRLFTVWLLVALAGGATAQVSNSAPVSGAAEVMVPVSLASLFSDESSYITRCKFVNGLKSDLLADEVDALLGFIESDPEEVGLMRGHFNSVADKVINVLQRQKTVPPALVDSLINMFNDPSDHFTWRDYCVQHLGSLYADEASAGRRDAIRAVFEAAMKPEARMSGTVVLALRNNIGQEGISKEFVRDKVSAVALDEEQPDSSRLTAIQVAAELGDRDMLPLAREIVPSRKYTVPFRMSSMATIGILGDASDLELLKKYTKSSDMRLRFASQAAVKKINAHLEERALATANQR